ncbi:MAG: phage portal protein [Candidatus Bathyarchaeota archaeon]|nr:phage portal protein [Candidatus Bathyarchaeota archaeon]
MLDEMKKKIDEDESWGQGSMHILTNKGLFPISVLKAAEKAKATAHSKQLKEDSLWLSTNDLVPYPFEASTLLELKDNCSYFDSCVKQIAKDVMGQGWRLELKEGKKENNAEKDQILEFIENSGGDRDETFEETLERGLIDWGLIGWWGWEVSRDNKGLVNGLWHVPAQTFYIHKDKDKYCQKRGQKEAWFKRFGLEENIALKDGKDVDDKKIKEEKDLEDDTKKTELANELIYYRNYYPQSEYYGAPNILPSVGAVLGLIGVRDYNLAFFENYGIPAALIILKGRWSKDTAKQISDFIDVELKGTEQSHKTFCIHPNKDSTFEYVKLGIEVKEGSFKLYRKGLQEEILVCYKMPPYRIGVAEVGALGVNVAGESTKIYAQSVITPLEEVVERLVTKKLFQEGLKADSYVFQLNELNLQDLDAEAARDNIYFGIGALTSNQILKHQGKEGYPEGNQYFVGSSFLPVGEEPMEKQEAVLEAVGMIVKGQPKLAAEIIKIAKREAKK